jgi:hypothetical protein
MAGKRGISLYEGVCDLFIFVRRQGITREAKWTHPPATDSEISVFERHRRLKIEYERKL